MIICDVIICDYAILRLCDYAIMRLCEDVTMQICSTAFLQRFSWKVASLVVFVVFSNTIFFEISIYFILYNF